MIFFVNQTMSSAGSIPANYAVTGPQQITLHGPGGTSLIGVQYVNQNQIVVTLQNQAAVMYRCSTNFAPPPPNNSGQGLTNAYFVGSWGENGNCTAPDVFLTGGQMRSGNGGGGTWALFGQTLRLTLTNGGTVDFDVQSNGRRNMTLTRAGFAPVNYTRC